MAYIFIGKYFLAPPRIPGFELSAPVYMPSHFSSQSSLKVLGILSEKQLRETKKTPLVNATLSFSSLYQPFLMVCIVSSLSLAVLIEFHNLSFTRHSHLCFWMTYFLSGMHRRLISESCFMSLFWRALKPAGECNMKLWQRHCDSGQAGEKTLLETSHALDNIYMNLNSKFFPIYKVFLYCRTVWQ